MTYDYQYCVISKEDGGYIRSKNNARPTLFLLLKEILKGSKIYRNFTSSGNKWYGYAKQYKRLNLYPISIWKDN
jgi:hypothetical protein